MPETARGFIRAARWLAPVCGLLLAFGLSTPHSADAVIERIYTLPFYSGYSIPPNGCFHCYYDPTYGWHEGTDYELGASGVGGEVVVAAAQGTAKPCPESPSAGNYVVIDHGNGHRTRYLHFNTQTLAGDQTVARGKLIGYEGNTGYTIPTGFYHLHFETRHGAQGAATCGKDGTAVDPSAASTYMWTLNPPVYASSCYLPQDSASGPGRYPGVFRPSQNHATWWHLKYSFSGGQADNSFTYGDTCDMPIVGDWDGDGDDTAGVVSRVGGVLQWRLSNDNSTPVTFNYGNATDFPVAGDWNGNGTDSIGVFRPSNAWRYLSDNNGTAAWVFPYGDTTDRPVVGDWDGDGDVTAGVVRGVGGAMQWHLSNDNSTPETFNYGNNTDVAITGDWDWDGDDTIGVFRPSEAKWYLSDNNSSATVPPFIYGAISDKPITGDWN